MSVPGAQPKRAVSWIFDVTIMVAGGLVGAGRSWRPAVRRAPRHAVDAGAAHRRTDRRPDEPVPARAQPLLQRHRGGLRLRGPGVPRLLPRGRGSPRHLGCRPGPLPGQPDQAHRRPHVQRRAGDPVRLRGRRRDEVGRRPREQHPARAERGRPRLRRLLPVRLPGLRRVARAGGPEPVARRAAPEHRAGRPGRVRGHRQPRLPRGAGPAQPAVLGDPAPRGARVHDPGRDPGAVPGPGAPPTAQCALRRRRRGAGRRVGGRARDRAARQRPGGGGEPVRRPPPGGPAAEGDRRPGPRRRADDVAGRARGQPGPRLGRGRPQGAGGARHGGRGGVRPAQPHRRDGPPGPPRRPHLAAEPHPVPGPGGAGRDPGPAQRHHAGGAVPRPGRLQGRQRPVRPRRG